MTFFVIERHIRLGLFKMHLNNVGQPLIILNLVILISGANTFEENDNQDYEIELMKQWNNRAGATKFDHQKDFNDISDDEDSIYNDYISGEEGSGQRVALSTQKSAIDNLGRIETSTSIILLVPDTKSHLTQNNGNIIHCYFSIFGLFILYYIILWTNRY